jgi:hypothetical protein
MKRLKDLSDSEIRAINLILYKLRDVFAFSTLGNKLINIEELNDCNEGIFRLEDRLEEEYQRRDLDNK